MKTFRLIGMTLVAIFMCVNFTSCGKDDDLNKPSYEDLTLLVGDTRMIEGSESWKSDNELIAKIEQNKLSALRKGETLIISPNYSFKVVVNANNNDFDEPYLNFGCNLSLLKKEMNSFNLVSETDEFILYEGIGNVSYYMYGFENKVLSLSSMFIPTTMMENLVKFMLERYVVITDDDDDYIGMVNPEKDMVILITAKMFNKKYFYVVAYGKANTKTKSGLILKDVFQQFLNKDIQHDKNIKKFIRDLYELVDNH